MFWRVSEEDRGEVVEADQHALDPGQQEDLVLPSANLAIEMLKYLHCHLQTLEILINKQYLIAEY